MKRYLPFVIIAAVLAVAVGAGFLMFRTSQPQTSKVLPPAVGPGATPNAAVSKGAVLIDEFGDYQCPPCGALHPILRTLKSEYGDRIQIAFHQFPLTQIHSHALEAAYAASAAGLQGKFWEMHDLLYERQKIWKTEFDVRPIFEGYAKEIGIDVERYKRDVSSDAVALRIQKDGSRGHSLGVKGTPTVFLNGREVPFESLPAEQLRVIIQREIESAGKK